MTVEWRPLSEYLVQRHDASLVMAGARYPIAGVLGFGRGILHRPAIDGSETSYSQMTRLEVGDVVYSKVKAFEGAVAIASESDSGRFVSPEFPVFSMGDGLDPNYLRHVLASEVFVAGLKRSSSGIGARRERVHPATFLGLRVPVPPIADQRRIAAHLDRLGTAPDPDASAHRAVVASLLDKLSWSSVAGDYMHFAPTELRVDGARAYRAMGVFGGGRGVIDRGGFSGADTKYATMYEVRAGQVIFSRLKAFEGAVAVVPPELDGALVSKEFPPFTLESGVDRDFIAAVVSTPRIVASMAAMSTGIGARRERLSKEDFLSLPMPSCPQSGQARVGAMYRLSMAAQAAAHRRSRLRNALVPAARNEIFNAMR